MDGAARLIAQLRPAVSDERVLEAIAAVPRERFVREPDRQRAWENTALPIECGQTISQPLVVARMLELLELGPEDRVLDVGTGSGYHAALLARLAAHVWTIERHSALLARAEDALAAVGVDNVTLHIGDGGDGLPECGPYDAINVAAAVEDDLPAGLTGQLAPGGRLVAPIGAEDQHLILVRRTAQGLEQETLEPVRFVPLVRGPLVRGPQGEDPA